MWSTLFSFTYICLWKKRLPLTVPFPICYGLRLWTRCARLDDGVDGYVSFWLKKSDIPLTYESEMKSCDVLEAKKNFC